MLRVRNICNYINTVSLIFIVDPCKGHKCPVGSRCTIYEPTGEPFCEPSCDLNNGGCPANQECTLKAVQCATDPCPPVVECTPRKQLCICLSIHATNSYVHKRSSAFQYKL